DCYPGKANQFRPCEHGVKPFATSLVLFRFRIVSIKKQVRVYQNHRCNGPSTCSMSSAILSRERPARRLPRSRAVILNGFEVREGRRVAKPRRKVSLTTSRKECPDRWDSDLSLAATSSSKVSVVRMR